MKNRCSKPAQAKTAWTKLLMYLKQILGAPNSRRFSFSRGRVTTCESWRASRFQVRIHLQQHPGRAKRRCFSLEHFALECLHAHANQRMSAEQLPQAEFQCFMHPASPLFTPVLFEPAIGLCD